MRCIFCKQNADSSKSKEHVVPESFGNYSFTLPKGIVCDKCNNYFAREVEKPFLELSCIQNLRFEVGLLNKKKKRIWPSDIYVNNGKKVIRSKFLMGKDENGMDIGLINVPPKFVTKNNKKITYSFIDEKELIAKNRITSRFLAKVAYESLALRFINDSEGLEWLINNKDFEPIINFIRYGSEKQWEYNVRRIYGVNEKIMIHNKKMEYVNWESIFIQTKQFELYFIVILYGMEYAINLGEGTVQGYLEWLQDHNNISPLYDDLE